MIQGTVLTDLSWASASFRSLLTSLNLEVQCPVVDPANRPYRQAISDELNKAKQKAAQEKKPLLMLVGENHESVYGTLLELTLTDVALKKLPIGNIFFEHFPYDGSALLNHADKLEPYACMQTYLKLMNISSQTVDYPTMCFAPKDMVPRLVTSECQFLKPFFVKHPKGENYFNIPNEDVETEIWFQKRDEGMAYMANELNDGRDVIMIVGAAHVRGILEELQKKNGYHVIVFAAFSAAEFESFKRVYNPSAFAGKHSIRLPELKGLEGCYTISEYGFRIQCGEPGSKIANFMLFLVSQGFRFVCFNYNAQPEPSTTVQREKPPMLNQFRRSKEEDISVQEMAKSAFGQGSNTMRKIRAQHSAKSRTDADENSSRRSSLR